MATIEFFMPMEKVPTVTFQAHRPTVGRDGQMTVYEPPRLAAARAKITDALAQHKPAKKLAGPLHLHVVWCFRSDKHPDGAWRDTRPDTDNLQKMLKDCMTRVGFWNDDEQVCSELIEKRWVRGIEAGGTASGIWIHVRKLEN